MLYCIAVCCNFVYGGVYQCISFHRGTPSQMKLFKNSICANTQMLQIWVCRGMDLLMILRLFHSPSWLLLMRILMQYFETIPSFHTYANGLHLKATGSF